MRRRHPKWLRRVKQLGSVPEMILTDWQGDYESAREQSRLNRERAASRFELPARYLGLTRGTGRDKCTPVGRGPCFFSLFERYSGFVMKSSGVFMYQP